MGKGTGCIPSSLGRRRPRVSGATADGIAAPTFGGKVLSEDSASSNSPPALDASSSPLPLWRTSKIYIVFYSMYGHVEALAKQMKGGIDSIEGVEASLFRVPETLSPDSLDKMDATSRDESIPTISVAELPAADGFVFGFPTRFGAMPAQMKAFFDSTGQLWEAQKLAGKPAGIFVSTGTQGGGQESTALTAITQLAHHGMLFVPIGYTFGAGMFKMDEIRGGSPYGSGSYSGDGTRSPSEVELALAEHQGKYMASVVRKLVSV